jgi:alpha-ketoglutarate-dependent taurine dioxygenase
LTVGPTAAYSRGMALIFQKLHPCLAAEASPVDLRRVHEPETLAEIRARMDEYAVLVFRNQPFTDEEQLAFARRLDGELHTKTGARALVNRATMHRATPFDDAKYRRELHRVTTLDIPQPV